MRLFRRRVKNNADSPAAARGPTEMMFPDCFRDGMLRGTKLIATRPSVFGEVGGRFSAFGCEFVIIDVKEFALGLVAKYLHRAEGCSSEEDFIDAWGRQYPDAGYDSARTVYVHLFTKAGPESNEPLCR